jgi:uncharacterized protein (DUF433 family)
MEYPEPLATIARMREAGHTDAKIAEHLGTTRREVQWRARNWNLRNPDKMPRANKGHDIRLPHEEIVQAYLDGTRVREIADRYNLAMGSVGAVIRKARLRTGIPYRRKPRAATTAATFDKLRAKGAALPQGSMTRLLNTLDMPTLERLLDHVDRNDETISDTVARILKDYLHGPR